MLEASEKHVGEMSVCMFGVAGSSLPFPRKEASRMSSRQKRQSMRRLREGVESVFVFTRKKEEVKLCLEGEPLRRKCIDSPPRVRPEQAGEAPKMRPEKKLV